MSALEAQLKGPAAGSEESGEGGPAPAAAAAASATTGTGEAGAAAGGATTAGAGAGAGASCTLVAKWQGSTIELPVLPSSTTIGEVKVGALGSGD